MYVYIYIYTRYHNSTLVPFSGEAGGGGGWQKRTLIIEGLLGNLVSIYIYIYVRTYIGIMQYNMI